MYRRLIEEEGEEEEEEEEWGKNSDTSLDTVFTVMTHLPREKE